MRNLVGTRKEQEGGFKEVIHVRKPSSLPSKTLVAYLVINNR